MNDSFTLRQLTAPAGPRRTLMTRGVWIALIAAAFALLLIVAGTAVGVWYVDRATLPVVDGIRAPDPECRTDLADLSHPWVTNGWWAGYVDGKPREMSTQAAMAMSIAGHDMRGVWLCPPR